jgi:small subunit ribosomal protein S7e
MASKIVKPAGAQPDQLELSVAQALLDLESSVAELKKELRPLQITAAKEVNLCINRITVSLCFDQLMFDLD